MKDDLLVRLEDLVNNPTARVLNALEIFIALKFNQMHQDYQLME